MEVTIEGELTSIDYDLLRMMLGGRIDNLELIVSSMRNDKGHWCDASEIKGCSFHCKLAKYYFDPENNENPKK